MRIYSILIMLFFSQITLADVTSSGQTTNTLSNQSGSNTAITGGYSSETTYQSGSSSNTTTTNTTNSNQKTAVNSATAPAMSIYSQQSCTIPLSLGMTTIGLSFSAGNYYLDEACELRRKVELLNKLGLKVAAVALLCTDPLVFESMAHAGTWCPHNGKIGDQAREGWLNERKEKLKTTGGTKPSMTWNNKAVPSGKINE